MTEEIKNKAKEESDSFWLPIIQDKHGNISKKKVLRELSDFSFILEQIPLIYCHITGDKLSKPMYHASTVIQQADDYYEEQHRDGMKDFLEDMETEGVITTAIKKKLLKRI